MDLIENPEFIKKLLTQRVPESNRPEVLVAIPSRAETVLAALLTTDPAKLVLLHTGDITRKNWEEIAARVASHPEWNLRAKIPPPPSADDDWCNDGEIIDDLDKKLGKTSRTRVYYLVTTGTSIHTTLLSQYCHATGGRLVHIKVPYKSDGSADNNSLDREFQFVGLPVEIDELYALQRARSFLAGGSPDRAREEIESLQRRSHLAESTLRWVKTCEHRAALRFPDALKEANDGLEFLERGQIPDRKKKDALHRCFTDSRAALQPLVAGDQPLDVAAEILAHARREHRLKRYNLAALLYYRFAEVATAHRLKAVHGFDVDRPDAGGLTARDDTLAERFESLGRALGNDLGSLEARCQRPFGLVDSVHLLLALRDGSIEGFNFKRFRELVTVRNRNILAHGFSAVDPDNLNEFAGLVTGTRGLERLLETLEPRGSWARTREAHVFFHLDRSGERIQTEA